MKSKRKLACILAVILIVTLFAGCSQADEQQKEIGPEVGKWHTEIRISDVSGSMSDEDRLLLSMLAGDIMFEIDAEFCEDGTFTYVMNTDQLQKAISDSVSTVLGYFISFDISLFTDRLVEATLRDEIQGSKHDYNGTYTTSESGLITAKDGAVLNFKIKGSALIELDSDGNEILTFTKVSGS